MGAPEAWAQSFPSVPPTLVMFDDYETTTAPRPPEDWLDGSGAIWDEWIYPAGSATDFTYYPSGVPAQVRGGLWGTRCIWEGLVARNWDGYLMARQSMPGDLGYVPADWTNIRIDVDMTVTRQGFPGIVWGVRDPDNDGIPDQGYRMILKQFPTLNQANNGDRATWTFERIDSELSSTVLDQGTHRSAVGRHLHQIHGLLSGLSPAAGVELRQPAGPGPADLQPLELDAEVLRLRQRVPEHRPRGLLVHPRRNERYQRHQPDAGNHRALPHRPAQRIGPEPDRYSTISSVSAWDPTCGSGCDPWSPWTETSSQMIPFKTAL